MNSFGMALIFWFAAPLVGIGLSELQGRVELYVYNKHKED